MTSGITREEVFRCVVTINESNNKIGIDWARGEVLHWAQRRAGIRFGPSAWNGNSFEEFSGGRTTVAECLNTDEYLIWSLTADDPDKSVPGRVWTNEVTIGWDKKSTPRLSVRQIVASGSSRMPFSPSTPTFLRQIAEKCQLDLAGHIVSPRAKSVKDEDELNDLVFLLSGERHSPVVVISEDERAEAGDVAYLDCDSLAKSLLGLAHVFRISAPMSYLLSDHFDKKRSVFFGAARIYMPGFNHHSSIFEHPLYKSEELQSNKELVEKDISERIARDSIRRLRLGHELISFSAVRSAAAKDAQEKDQIKGAPSNEQFEKAVKRIDALEAEVKLAKEESERSLQAAIDEEERAIIAERQLFNATMRLKILQETLSDKGVKSALPSVAPISWEDFEEWVDENFVAEIALSPAARRNIRDAQFNDLNVVAQCIQWLANDCLEIRRNGGGALANISIFEGIENAPCGTDAFDFVIGSTKLTADWHIKTGGNTRDPVRCLRIYYSYDVQNDRIVIADLPAHRRSSAT
ncbi:MAG: hypothetical protein IOC54_18140 [Methylobacterium sp.]|nr:hypothetical protein [Methylobacterium sp.]MCA3653724.1 hypothetical protein [Methylobacterium sp.]MCA4924003.1 hypothetical protein [Methylobacterium sp.]